MEKSESTGPLRTPTRERLQSLDTLRGFDMAMLVGGCGILTLQWGLMYFLYKKKIFLRV